MPEPVVHYNEASDTLYIAFAPGEVATGVLLHDHLLLRLNKAEHRPIGLTVFDYSLLAQPTEAGPWSLPLTGLARLSEDMRAMVLAMLRRPPLDAFLHLTTYTLSWETTVPLVTLRPVATVAGVE